MNVDTFRKVAQEVLDELTKGKKYGWTNWQPEDNFPNTTFQPYYKATLWKNEEDSLEGTIEIPYDLDEVEARAQITKWLKQIL